MYFISTIQFNIKFIRILTKKSIVPFNFSLLFLTNNFIKNNSSLCYFNNLLNKLNNWSIKLSTYNNIILKPFIKELSKINYFSITMLPTKIKKLTVLKSTQNNKTARDQYEQRHYFCYFYLKRKNFLPFKLKILLKNKTIDFQSNLFHSIIHHLNTWPFQYIIKYKYQTFLFVKL